MACTTNGVFCFVKKVINANKCWIWLCTHPSLTNPKRCTGLLAVFARAHITCNSSWSNNDQSWIARSILTNDCIFTLPVPSVLCPTSLFPTCQRGNQTASSLACNVHRGTVSYSESIYGVFAFAVADLSTSVVIPRPSRIISATLLVIVVSIHDKHHTIQICSTKTKEN